MEEGVDGRGGEVEGWAEEGSVCGEDREGFGGCDWSCVGVGAEGEAGGCEEGGEVGGGRVRGEDGVGADDDEFYEGPFVGFIGVGTGVGPGDQFGDLGRGRVEA